MTEPTLSTEAAIIQWAKDKGLDDPVAQAWKTREETDELFDIVSEVSYLEDMNEEDYVIPYNEVKLELGDVLVTLIIQAHLQGTTVRECLELAWNKIKDRKGITRSGVFIKEEDL